jgi:heptosyltransferase-2
MKKPYAVVIMPTWVGDCVMALASLRTALEGEEVMLLGQARILELVSGEFGHLLLPMEKKGIWAGARLLLKQKSHRGILLPNSFGSAIMGLVGGLCTLTGTPKDGRGWLLYNRVTPSSEHQAWRYREILKAGGVTVDPAPKPWLSLPASAQERAEELILERRVGDEPLLAVHTGSSKKERCWPFSRFVSVCKSLCKEGWRVVVLGGPTEKDMATEMASSLGSSVALNVPEENLSLAEMAAVISHCSLFLGNDSGPMHLASALGVKVVAVFSSTSPKQTAPLLPAEMKREVWSSFGCSPCRERFFQDCSPIDGVAPCLNAISEEDVLSAVKELI